jgi:hypothetical protein
MEAFRPNIVVTAEGLSAWNEDGWRNIMIGQQPFVAVRPCSRCTIPTIDVKTAKKSPFGEPLQTLRKHRKLVDEYVSFSHIIITSAHSLDWFGCPCPIDVNSSVYFGQHLVQMSIGGRVSIGDEIKIQSRKAASLEKSAVPPPKPKAK